MRDPLVEMKKRLGRAFLGKARIHGLGLSRTHKAIQVYVSPGQAEDQQTVLEDLRQAALPFDVIVVVEDCPRLS